MGWKNLFGGRLVDSAELTFDWSHAPLDLCDVAGDRGIEMDQCPLGLIALVSGRIWGLQSSGIIVANECQHQRATTDNNILCLCDESDTQSYILGKILCLIAQCKLKVAFFIGDLNLKNSFHCDIFQLNSVFVTKIISTPRSTD